MKTKAGWEFNDEFEVLLTENELGTLSMVIDTYLDFHYYNTEEEKETLERIMNKLTNA